MGIGHTTTSDHSQPVLLEPQGAWMTLENPGAVDRAGQETGEAQRTALFNNAWTFTLPVLFIGCLFNTFHRIPKKCIIGQ